MFSIVPVLPFICNYTKYTRIQSIYMYICLFNPFPCSSFLSCRWAGEGVRALACLGLPARQDRQDHVSKYYCLPHCNCPLVAPSHIGRSRQNCSLIGCFGQNCNFIGCCEDVLFFGDNFHIDRLPNVYRLCFRS